MAPKVTKEHNPYVKDWLGLTFYLPHCECSIETCYLGTKLVYGFVGLIEKLNVFTPKKKKTKLKRSIKPICYSVLVSTHIDAALVSTQIIYSSLLAVYRICFVHGSENVSAEKIKSWCRSFLIPANQTPLNNIKSVSPNSKVRNLRVIKFSIFYLHFSFSEIVFLALLLLQDSFGKKLMDRIRPTQPRSCTVLFVRLYHGVSTQLRFLPCWCRSTATL